MSLNITKTGIFNGQIIEPFITLSDGSLWRLMLFHYVDGGNHLFTSSNWDYCNEHGLFSRLKYINNFTYNNKYEFYVIQDDIIHRWTQTSQPTAASIAGMTVIEGNPVNGLAKQTSQSNTYIGYNTWWGACGCKASYTTGGVKGIPGFGPHNTEGMCTQYLALYVRIENINAFEEATNLNGREIYEY